jgi:rhodanese-related sulfurtransferase
MPVGVYCYTGQTSAQVAAYLQMMGYDGKTVYYGVQKMCYEDEAINDVPWHGPELNDYTAIFEGTGLPQ